ISTQVRQEAFAGIDEEDLRKCQQVHARILANLDKR
ncbi:MAG TPA: MarR family transcriptional regulator, partial [Pseudomonas sp.]|nr:MarR family transcriptional regulator [Pseudomonas sp.]